MIAGPCYWHEPGGCLARCTFRQALGATPIIPLVFPWFTAEHDVAMESVYLIPACELCAAPLGYSSERICWRCSIRLVMKPEWAHLITEVIG